MRRSASRRSCSCRESDIQGSDGISKVNVVEGFPRLFPGGDSSLCCHILHLQEFLYGRFHDELINLARFLLWDLEINGHQLEKFIRLQHWHCQPLLIQRLPVGEATWNFQMLQLVTARGGC
jgi:hypothetical protein